MRTYRGKSVCFCFTKSHLRASLLRKDISDSSLRYLLEEGSLNFHFYFCASLFNRYKLYSAKALQNFHNACKLRRCGCSKPDGVTAYANLTGSARRKTPIAYIQNIYIFV